MKPLLSRFTGSLKARLDAKDDCILACLAQDGFMPTKDIAKKVMLSKDSVGYRIRCLQLKGVIQGFVPMTNLAKFGLSEFCVFFLLHEKEHSHHQAFLEHLINHKNTLSVMLYTDTWDVEWVLVAKDLTEVDALLAALLNEYVNVILRKEVIPVLYKHLNRSVLTKVKNSSSSHESIPTLDALDYDILKLLCEGSRQSTYDICKRAGCSPDTVSRRIKALMQQGIILGFQPVINMAALGKTWYTYSIKFATPEKDTKINEFIASQPLITSAAKTFGQWNLLLTIVPETGQQYHDIVKKIKNTFSDTIYDYQTWLAHKELIFRTVPLCIFNAESKK